MVVTASIFAGALGPLGLVPMGRTILTTAPEDKRDPNARTHLGRLTKCAIPHLLVLHPVAAPLLVHWRRSRLKHSATVALSELRLRLRFCAARVRGDPRLEDTLGATPALQ